MEFEKIPLDVYDRLISTLEFGSSIAEADDLLTAARIETSVFTELVQDKVDMIIGCKGSGKTALFKLLTTHLDHLLLEGMNTVLINGADEPKGDPIFQYFSTQFNQFTEEDFENFWKIYFVYLLNERIFQSSSYRKVIKTANVDVDKFKTECQKLGIPFIKESRTLLTLVNEALKAVPKIKSIEAKVSIGSIKGGITFDDHKSTEDGHEKNPLFLSKILQIVKSILTKSDLKVWIMMDRLDEVFQRHSDIERKALKSLLKCLSNYHSSEIRLKIFLRDDIFESVTSGGFSALTHVTHRCSERLNWAIGEILHLVVKRAAQNDLIKDLYQIDIEEIDKNQNYRKELFYKMFPDRVKGSATIEWIYRMCIDGKDVVAPRDVIELLQAAKRVQEKSFRSHKEDQQYLLSQNSLVEGFTAMSKNKRDRTLAAEFPDLIEIMKKFEDGRAGHYVESLETLLGNNWEKKVKRLESIGFIKRNQERHTFTIPYLYRPCFNIKQGNTKRNNITKQSSYQ